MANINDFKAVMQGGGARANQFQVTMPFPGYSTTGGETRVMSFLTRASNLPGMTLGEIAVPFRGRQLYIAGDRTFEPWSVTVVNDGQFGIRKAFETWSRGINALTENVSQLGFGDDNPGYCVDLEVFQLGRDQQKPNKTPQSMTAQGRDGMEVIRAYKFYDAWPSSLSAIDLSYESNDQIEEFTVEFQYNYYEVSKASLDTGV